jgi:hypothetical protein
VRLWLVCSPLSLLLISKYTIRFGLTGHLHVFNLVCEPFKVTATAVGSSLAWHPATVHMFSIYGLTYFGVRQSWVCLRFLNSIYSSLQSAIVFVAWRYYTGRIMGKYKEFHSGSGRDPNQGHPKYIFILPIDKCSSVNIVSLVLTG